MYNPIQTLHQDVRLIFSSAYDGSMAAGGGVESSPDHTANAEAFLKRHDFSLKRNRILVQYGDRTYREVKRLDADSRYGDVVCDAMYTTEPGRVITLPVADCVATVVYDPVTNILGVLHLGRHSSLAGLIEAFVIEVADNVGSDPRDWLVWMSPSLRQPHDRMEYFTPADSDEWRDFVDVRENGIYIDVVGHNQARFERVGVRPGNIIISPIDTYVDERFFSHRAAHQQNRRDRQGRMVVAARLINHSSNG